VGDYPITKHPTGLGVVMSPEGHKPSELLSTLAVIGGLLLLSEFAFSKGVRKQILDRDKHKSVWSGKTENLEAAHISHNKADPKYNTAENGRMLTTGEHLQDHINRAGTEGLGLSNYGNDWAINMIWRRFWGLDKRGD